jgi:hypothetical protein
MDTMRWNPCTTITERLILTDDQVQSPSPSISPASHARRIIPRPRVCHPPIRYPVLDGEARSSKPNSQSQVLSTKSGKVHVVRDNQCMT